MLCRYGLIDRIVQPQDAVAMDEKNYEAMLQKSQAQQRGGPRQAEGRRGRLLKAEVWRMPLRPHDWRASINSVAPVLMM